MEIGFLDVLITVVALMLIAIPGFLLVKSGLIKKEAGKAFSTLVLYGCQPLLLFMSFQKTNYSKELTLNMLYVAILSLFVHAVMIAFVMLVFKNKDKNQKVNSLKFASVFGNCGYMGLPFLQALFTGTGVQGEILIYGGVIITVFNFLTWSIGIYMITGDKKQICIRNALLNPTVIAMILGIIVFFIAKVPLVNLAEQGSTLDRIIEKVMQSANYLSDMVTPLAMIVLGMRLAGINFKQLFTEKWAYVNAFNKLILSSLVAILLVAFLPVSSVVKYSIFFLLSMPSATNTVLFAEKFGGDADTGSIMVVLSTILSIITIPLMFLVINGIFGVAIV